MPHSPHFARHTLPTSLSALAVHRLQWEWCVRPYVAKLRPHSLHVDGSAAGAPRRARPVSRPARVRVFVRGRRGGRPPLARALRAAAAALVRAIIAARFSGSAMYLRMYPRTRRRLPSARHSSEQYRGTRLAVENALPHSLHSTRRVLPAFLPALAAHRRQRDRPAPRPYGAKVRPHSLQAGRTDIAPRIECAVIRLAGRTAGAGLLPAAPERPRPPPPPQPRPRRICARRQTTLAGQGPAIAARSRPAGRSLDLQAPSSPPSRTA